MCEVGYKLIIEFGKEQVNLFYEYEEECFLIEKDNGCFVVNEFDFGWMMDEFYIYMEEYFECFSNNVVMRLLMQEYFILILVFIVGFGEINYWGEFKQVFVVMGFKMFFVMLRLNIMIFEWYIEKKLFEWNILL